MNSILVLRFGLPLFVWLLVFFESISDMVSVWSQSKTYEHGFLILPLSLWLVWQEKDRFRFRQLSTAWLPAILLVVPCLLWIVGRLADIAFFEHVAAVLSLQLIIWALIGNTVAKTFYFPILYLSFCIPFGEELIPYLQSITADMSVALVRLSGIPIYREGMFLTIPNGQFEVAEACSGIRFLISSIALGSLFAYLFFNKWVKMGIFIAFSCIFPVIANGFRAYGIIMVGHLSDMRYATGADHLIYGWVFFSIVTAMSFFIAFFFQDRELQNTNKSSKNINVITKNNSSVISIFISLLLVTIAYWEKSSTLSKVEDIHPMPLPINFTKSSSSLWGINFTHAQYDILAYTEDNQVEFYNAYYNLSQPQGELISSNNTLYDKERWSPYHHDSYKIKNNLEASEITVVNINGDLMKIIYCYCIDDHCSNSALKIKLLTAYYLMLNIDAKASIAAFASSRLTSPQLLSLIDSWYETEKI